jgi:hypothetical protein
MSRRAKRAKLRATRRCSNLPFLAFFKHRLSANPPSATTTLDAWTRTLGGWDGNSPLHGIQQDEGRAEGGGGQRLTRRLAATAGANIPTDISARQPNISAASPARHRAPPEPPVPSPRCRVRPLGRRNIPRRLRCVCVLARPQLDWMESRRTS